VLSQQSQQLKESISRFRFGERRPPSETTGR
jgi:hypothetical protein